MGYERNQLSGECKRDGWNITMKMKLNLLFIGMESGMSNDDAYCLNLLTYLHNGMLTISVL